MELIFLESFCRDQLRSCFLKKPTINCGLGCDLALFPKLFISKDTRGSQVRNSLKAKHAGLLSLAEEGYSYGGVPSKEKTWGLGHCDNSQCGSDAEGSPRANPASLPLDLLYSAKS